MAKKIEPTRKESITFIVKKEFYEQIKAGTKRIEYRDISHFWANRLIDDRFYYIHFELVIFQLGYTKERLYFEWVKTIEKKGLFEIHFE